MNKKKITIILFTIIVLALIIRLPNMNAPFCSNDHTTIQLFSIDSIPQNGLNSLTSIDNYGMGNPLRIVASNYGITLSGLTLATIATYNTLNIPLTETTWRLPFLIIGLISLILIYIATKQFTSKKTAILTTLIIAFLPGHISWSKDPSNSLLLVLPAQLLAFLFFSKYLETKKKSAAIVTSLATAFAILSDNLFPQLLATMTYIYVVYEKKSILKSIKKILNPNLIILPILAMLVHIITFIAIKLINNSTIGTNAGAIGHILSKEKFLGFNMIGFFNGLSINTSIVIATLISIITIIGFLNIFKFKKQEIPLAAGLAYAIPLIFFIDPSNIDFTVYAFTPAIFLTIYCMSIIKSKKITHIITIIAILSVIMTAITANDNFIGYGKHTEDCGTKTAGYWARNMIPENSKILTISDGIGNGAIGPVIGKYYFKQETHGLFNHNNKKYIDLINNDEYTHIVTKPNQEIENIIKKEGFKINYIIKNKSEILLNIYSKENKPSEILNTEKYNKLFNKKYNKIEDFINAPNYVADSPPWI